MNTSGAWHCLTERATPEGAALSGRAASQPFFALVAGGIFGLVLDRFGGGRGPGARLFFTLNADLLIGRGLTAERKVRALVYPIRRTDKVIETGISLVEAGTGARLAFCHHTGAYINRETRRIDPLGETAARMWDEQASGAATAPGARGTAGGADDDATGGMPPMEPMAIKPRGVGMIRSLEGVILPEWIDRMGHMGIEHYGLILDRASEGALRSMTPPLKPALPRRIQVRYLKEIQLGRPFHVLSWLPEPADRPLRIEHELWSGPPDAPGELAARCVEETSASA